MAFVAAVAMAAMNAGALRSQVIGSELVDDFDKVATIAGLLQVPPRSLKLTKLFSTNTDGWNAAAAFHASCDGQGPTITLVRRADHRYYGGYASRSWTMNGYIHDAAAFLFRFHKEPQKTVVEKFMSKKNGNELYGHKAYGPVFGTGHDLVTFGSRGNILTSSQDPGDYHFVKSNSFEFPTSTSFIDDSMPKKHANFRLEVLKVGTMDNAELEDPWLPHMSWLQQDMQHLQDEVFGFDPTKHGLPVDHVNILLCGGVGAGKSSIASTVDSICQGRISRRAPHGQGTGSLTRKLRKYSFTNPASKETVKWQLWDSMGWGVSDYRAGELGFILDGNLPDQCKLDDNVSVKTRGFNTTPSLQDAVHCMCLVVPCDSATDDSYMSRLREMRQFAREREIPALVMLTKVDTYDPDVIGNDLSKLFHSARLLHLIEELEGTAGVGGQKDILPIKNLSNETAPSVKTSILMLKALQQALYAAMDYLRECEDTETSSADTETGSVDTENAQVVVAKQDCAGNKKAGILPLQKGSLYWVEPSATKAGWMLGCDSDGNQGRFPKVTLHAENGVFNEAMVKMLVDVYDITGLVTSHNSIWYILTAAHGNLYVQRRVCNMGTTGQSYRAVIQGGF